MSYRHPLLKTISSIITTIILIVFSMPRTMFLESMRKWVIIKKHYLCAVGCCFSLLGRSLVSRYMSKWSLSTHHNKCRKHDYSTSSTYEILIISREGNCRRSQDHQSFLVEHHRKYKITLSAGRTKQRCNTHNQSYKVNHYSCDVMVTHHYSLGRIIHRFEYDSYINSIVVHWSLPVDTLTLQQEQC